MTNNKRKIGLLAFASLTLCGCDRHRPAVAVHATNYPAIAAPRLETTATNLVEVSLVGNVTREETVFSKTGGEERRLVRYMLVTADGEKWALQAVAAREALSQVVGQTMAVKGLARGRLVKRITQLKPLPPENKVNTTNTTESINSNLTSVIEERMVTVRSDKTVRLVAPGKFCRNWGKSC